DMSRAAFNRATNEEQRAHAAKQRAAGKKTVYLVNDYDLGKTAYDYAAHLIALHPKADQEHLQQSSVESKAVAVGTSADEPAADIPANQDGISPVEQDGLAGEAPEQGMVQSDDE